MHLLLLFTRNSILSCRDCHQQQIGGLANFWGKNYIISTQITVSRSYEYNATRHSTVSFFCICFIDCEKRIWLPCCIRVLYSVRWRKSCRGAWSHSSMHSSPTYWTEMAAHHYVFTAQPQDKTSVVAIKYEAGLESRCGRFGKEKITCLLGHLALNLVTTLNRTERKTRK